MSESAPTVVVHVELPAYSRSFDVQVPESATVFNLKQAIAAICIGHPRPDGQRVIWRGRYLDDQEKIRQLWPRQEDQRTVHLSVRPSAWTSSPPSADATASHSVVRDSSPVGLQNQSLPPSVPHLNDSLAFIRFKHSQALCWLSNSKLTAPTTPGSLEVMRSAAKLALARLGYAWPDILDTAPPPTSTDNLDYEVVTIDGKSYLSLLTPTGTPSSLQLHALSILTYTFSIYSLPSLSPSPMPASFAPNTSVPPHVNDLLRELGLPLLQAVPNGNIAVTVQPDVAAAPPIPEHAEANLIREIPMRALLAPLLMVVFRTVLLLYFFSPTRKPLLGLCLIAWLVYEMWTHVRIVILRPVDRAGDNGPGLGMNGAQPDEAADGTPPVAPAAPDNLHAGDRNPFRPAGRVPNTEPPTRDTQQIQGPPIPRQSNGIIDSLALASVHQENKLLWPLQQPAIPLEPPTLLHKITSFLSLFVVTMHPEVYNRRRTALRQREGRLRTEINAIERGVETRDSSQVPSEEEQRKHAFVQQLQAQHAQRPAWVKRYVESVRKDDWIEE